MNARQLLLLAHQDVAALLALLDLLQAHLQAALHLEEKGLRLACLQDLEETCLRRVQVAEKAREE